MEAKNEIKIDMVKINWQGKKDESGNQEIFSNIYACFLKARIKWARYNTVFTI